MEVANEMDNHICQLVGSIPLKCTMNIILPHRSVEGQDFNRGSNPLGVQICYFLLFLV